MTDIIFKNADAIAVEEPAGFIERVELTVDGEAIEAPVFEVHKRGKNWACYFTGKNAANASRHFLPQRGKVIDISRLDVGMPIEIAGDYTSSGGRPHPDRWIGVIVEKTDELLVVDRYQTVAKAISSANKRILSVPLPADTDVLEAMADPDMTPVNPQALAASVTELEAFLEAGEGILSTVTNEVSFAESIALVLHELKRLQQMNKEATNDAPAA
jgi:hypothetical protein